jgi:uncharacterized protein
MKRLSLLSGIAVLALSAPPALAQQYMPAPVVEPGHTVLTVTAQGTSDAAPDVAIFSAGVQTQAKTAAEALAENSRKMERVIAALKAAGIAARDIQTNNLSVNPVYVDPEHDAMMAVRAGQPYVPPPNNERLRRIVGYEVSNNVMVRQRDLKNFGRVIDTLVEAGATQVNGPNFQLEEQEPSLDKARIEAMRAARQRGELYARAAGLRIVRILSITEGGGYAAPPPVFYARTMDVSAPSPPPAPIEPGQLQMMANVTVLYELAP